MRSNIDKIRITERKIINTHQATFHVRKKILDRVSLNFSIVQAVLK